MPYKIISDELIRKVVIEHTCKDGGSTYRGVFYAEPGRDSGYYYGPELRRFCGHCGEALPQKPEARDAH